MPQNVPQKVSTNWKLFKSTLSENTPFLPPTINNNDDIDTEIENLPRNIFHASERSSEKTSSMPQNVPQKVSTNWKLFKSTLSENTPFLPPTINNNDDIDTEIENLPRNIFHASERSSESLY
ncbi:hypothetical protein CDAR_447111 [Caerostris darwini]|uniref:Uncharacterized protein n=1 Tax=Caerostris darwini TaxID=1538125 RepID=A0AAV4P5A5_9ARAC|nr:hypothetical protein CDAR_447111 [Caerostris darwini]